MEISNDMICMFQILCRKGSCNRYHFDPNLPEDYSEALNRQKAFYDLYQRGKGNRIQKDRVLGTMIGTVAQNYAFCGPQYLANAVASSREACELFDRKQDLLRQYSYLFFAYLSAGKSYFEKAGDFLVLSTGRPFRPPARQRCPGRLPALRFS